MRTELFDRTDKRECYTSLGLDIDHKIAATLRPMIREWANRGISVRDLGLVIDSSARDCILEQLIGWADDQDASMPSKKEGPP